MLTHALLNLEIECAFLRMRFSESISRGAGENVKSCGAERNRTDDVLLAKQVLYQLSYSPAGERAVVGDPRSTRPPVAPSGDGGD